MKGLLATSAFCELLANVVCGSVSSKAGGKHM